MASSVPLAHQRTEGGKRKATGRPTFQYERTVAIANRRTSVGRYQAPITREPWIGFSQPLLTGHVRPLRVLDFMPALRLGESTVGANTAPPLSSVYRRARSVLLLMGEKVGYCPI